MYRCINTLKYTCISLLLHVTYVRAMENGYCTLCATATHLISHLVSALGVSIIQQPRLFCLQINMRGKTQVGNGIPRVVTPLGNTRPFCC